MSKSFLNAQTRTDLGSNKSRHLRRDGFIPASLYGGHMAPQPVMIEKNEFEKFMASNNLGSKIYVKFEGTEVMALLKGIQKDVFGSSILHVDLQALTKEDKVKLKVRLNYIGKDKISPDLISQELLNELEIETLPENMIDSISVDISGLKFGDIIKVSDLPITQDPNIRVNTDLNLPLINLAYRARTAAPEVVEEA